MRDQCQAFNTNPRTAGAVAATTNLDGELMDVPEIAHLLRVPDSWVYARTRRHGRDRIPHIKLGKYLRFEPAAVREWLSSMRTS